MEEVPIQLDDNQEALINNKKITKFPEEFLKKLVKKFIINGFMF